MLKLALALAWLTQAYVLPADLKDKLFEENRRGLELYSQGRYLEAAEVFAKAEREIAYGEPFLLMNAAKAYYGAKRYSNANNYHDELLRQKKELEPSFLLLMAKSYAYEDRWQDAARALNEALKASPEDAAIHDWKAASLYATGMNFRDVATWWGERRGLGWRDGDWKRDFAAALQRVFAAIALANQDAGARYREIYALARLYRFRDACASLCDDRNDASYPTRDALRRIGALQASVTLKLAPTPEALDWAKKGRAAASSDWSEAAKAYEKAVLESPWWADAHFDRAVALFAVPDGPSAVASMDAYLAFEPTGSRARKARRLVKQWSKALR